MPIEERVQVRAIGLLPNRYTSKWSLSAVSLLAAIFALWCVFAIREASDTVSAINLTLRHEKVAKTGYLADPCGLESVVCPDEEQARWRLVSAYNPVPEQTDGDPCRTANGTNICEGLARGERYVSTNELPFGTKVEIEGEVYTVVDRTNGRYTHRYDIAMPADQVEAARQWGRKIINVKIVK